MWGALWGSFLNVCITRIPQEESIVSPRSHCRQCGALVRFYDNIPIVSYLLLRGKCRSCQAEFSPQYLVVEVISAGFAVLLWHWVVADAPSALAILRWAFYFAFTAVLTVISAIDLATYRIPNVITYPGIPLFSAASLLLGHAHFWDGPLGAVLGYASLRLLADGYFWLTGREGMGYGDAKLLSLTGGFLGWSSLLPTVFVGSMVGVVVGVAVALVRRRAGSEVSIRLTRIPFGPFLALGAVSTLFFGDPLTYLASALLAR